MVALEGTYPACSRSAIFCRGRGSFRDTSLSTEVSFVRDSKIKLSSPLYLGDMSFGALSGTPNIAIARAAEETGVIAGTGEGGLLKEVSDRQRVTVQWASARFGVSIDSLAKSQAVVIKIGQGAKPGIGGHLPGVKVTRPISETRRTPVGRDAISPAPHHDIYSIEDLGQRIMALKEATGKPVLVKVGATNYIPYVASGIARMGADGIIIDGAGAGTGAAPSVVKNNVGIPIELALASVDSKLRQEGLRDNFTVIAAGKVSCPEDSLKLMALGADITSLGTAALLALGCLMVHKCHLGYCPAILTNKISESQSKVLSLSQSIFWLKNLVAGWTDEMKEILRLIGISSVQELRGRRDLLFHSSSVNEETLEILGIPSDRVSFEEGGYKGSTLELIKSQNPFTQARASMLAELAGTTGKMPAEAEISSMGSVAAPFVEAPSRLADWLVSDGAQVTRPSIDPYREEIEIFTYLPRSRLRLAAPFFFTHLPNYIPQRVQEIFARTACSMGLLFDCSNLDLNEKYSDRTISHLGQSEVGGIFWLSPEELISRNSGPGFSLSTPEKNLLLRLPSSETAMRWISSNLEIIQSSKLTGLIIDEDSSDSDLPLELSLPQIDKMLKDSNVRYNISILAEGNLVRGSDDIFKLVALGADCVGIGKAALIAIGFEEGEVVFNAAKSTKHIENFVVALEKEVKLLAGAAGVSSLCSSLVGNRELLRSVDLEPELRMKMGVKPAGAA